MNNFLVFLMISCALSSIIVGGTNGESPADEKELILQNYPYLVSLYLISFGHRCTSTIISHTFVMTSAHCLYDFKKRELLNSADLRLVHGAQEMDSSLDHITSQPEAEVRHVASVHVHPKFHLDKFYHDIAMLQVDAPWGERAKLVTIPSFHVFGNALPKGYVCHVVGWWSTGKCGDMKTVLPSLISGVQYPELRALKQQEKIPTLNITQMNIIEEDRCTNMVNKNGLLIKEISICTAPKEADNCDGDPGAPLICNNLQVGILSWGLGYKENGRAMPIVYVRLDNYLYWMDTVVTIFESEAVMAGPHVVLLALPMLLAVLEVTL
ncbi:trypsin-like [Bacillus rossius redtenbacheri]|uniref:trypsin-like n=1 Tax=Bacillus rossius redtenbacheri TaxID=93214 RepID=UPI002FDED2AE